MAWVSMVSGSSSSKCVLTPQSLQESDIMFWLKENSYPILSCSPDSIMNNQSEISMKVGSFKS